MRHGAGALKVAQLAQEHRQIDRAVHPCRVVNPQPHKRPRTMPWEGASRRRRPSKGVRLATGTAPWVPESSL